MEIIKLEYSLNTQVVWERVQDNIEMVSTHTVEQIITKSYNPYIGKNEAIRYFIAGGACMFQAFFTRSHFDKKDLKKRGEEYLNKARENGGVKKDTKGIKTLIHYKLSGVKEFVSESELRHLQPITIKDIENEKEL